jgi:ABC-type multidrug transport system fused ATPase/permease subunit
MAARYSQNLGKARDFAIKLKCKSAMAGALLLTVMFVMYGAGFWYGGSLIANDRLTAIVAFPPPDGFAELNSAFATSEWASQNAVVQQVCSAYTETQAYASCACSIPFPSALKSPDCGCGHMDKTLLGDASTCTSTGTVLAAFFCLITGAFSLGQLAPAIQALAKARVSAKRIYDIIDRKPTIDVTAGTLPIKT